MKDDRGQLRSYFNACPTVKLGILTDGLKYEFYADCDKPNMMDDVAFLRLDLAEVAKDGAIDDNTLGGIAAIRKGLFNPEDVGAEAKKKLLFESFVNLIKKFKSDPSDDFIKFILGQSEAGSKIRVTQKIVDANRDVVRSAMEAFVAQEALSRFGYAPKDVVRTVPVREEPATAAPAVALEPEAEIVFPSEGEMKALTYAKNRLFYLVRNDVLFQEVQKITFSKTKTSFRVYYERRNNGALFDYREHRDGKAVLQFPALGGGDVTFVFSAELDDCLLKSFTRRVTEAGVSFELSACPPYDKGRAAWWCGVLRRSYIAFVDIAPRRKLKVRNDYRAAFSNSFRDPISEGAALSVRAAVHLRDHASWRGACARRQQRHRYYSVLDHYS